MEGVELKGLETELLSRKGGAKSSVVKEESRGGRCRGERNVCLVVGK